MNNYSLNKSIVSDSEALALKEMIFQRARERAQALNDEVQSSYTSSVQTDIMDLARASFVESKNPFAQKSESDSKINNESPKNNEPEIGFPIPRNHKIKTHIEHKNTDINSDVADAAIKSAMVDARSDFTKKTSFMGALNFLNSQATIALVKNRGTVFEAIA